MELTMHGLGRGGGVPVASQLKQANGIARKRFLWTLQENRILQGAEKWPLAGPALVSLSPNRYPTLKGGVFNGGNGYTVSRPAVRFDEADRICAHDRAEMAGRAEARQGDSRRRREGAPDTARRSAHDLHGRGGAVWLRRVHPPRDLAGDAARDDAEQALVPGGTGQEGRTRGEALFLPSLYVQTRVEPRREQADSGWKHRSEGAGLAHFARRRGRGRRRACSGREGRLDAGRRAQATSR